MMPGIIDTHTHLDAIHDLKSAMKKAQVAGVTGVVAVGMDFISNQKTLSLAGDFGGIMVYPALGIHPWKLAEPGVEKTLSHIKKNIADVVAIGEIGLDFWLKEARKDLRIRQFQTDTFRLLLQACKEHHKPALIHARGAWEEALSTVKEARIEKAVFHWYSGPLNVLREILSAGYFISATPALRYSREHRAAIEAAPIDRVLVETDSPVKYQGVEAGPADVLQTLNFLAALKNQTLEAVREVTFLNAVRFFNLEEIKTR